MLEFHLEKLVSTENDKKLSEELHGALVDPVVPNTQTQAE